MTVSSSDDRGRGAAGTGVEDQEGSDLFVVDMGGRTPFSKGLLAQSLLATAMSQSDAFAAAHEIERELEATGVDEIDRSELRDLVERVLSRRFGDDTARRFMLWRRHQEPDRPVVVLLGGTSGVGKSSLAVEVARRLGISRVLSTDSIRQIMRIMTSSQLVPAIYASSYDAWRRLPVEGGRIPTVIDGFRAQARAVSLGVRASIERTVSESTNLVIDGVSLVPGIVDPAEWAGAAHVFMLIVAARDEEALRQRFVARAGDQRRRLPQRYIDNLDSIVAIQNDLIEEAERHGVPVIDNVRFDTSVRQIIDHVTAGLAAREADPAASQPGLGAGG